MAIVSSRRHPLELFTFPLPHLVRLQYTVSIVSAPSTKTKETFTCSSAGNFLACTSSLYFFNASTDCFPISANCLCHLYSVSPQERSPRTLKVPTSEENTSDTLVSQTAGLS